MKRFFVIFASLLLFAVSVNGIVEMQARESRASDGPGGEHGFEVKLHWDSDHPNVVSVDCTPFGYHDCPIVKRT